MNPKGSERKEVLFRGVWRDNAKKKNALAVFAPMVVGDGMMLVPMCLRGLVQLLMALKIRLIKNSGAMALVAWQDYDDDNSEVLAKDSEHMKANANRVPIGPSDCNRGMYVWPSTVGPKPDERRSKGRAVPKLCKQPQGCGPVDRVWKSQWAHVPGPREILAKRT